LDDNNIITYNEGFTPLIEVKFDDKTVLIKQEHLFQTGSYKDRGASVLVSKVKELGIQRIVEDSSGNAGCAIAAYCTAAGIICDIYVPQSTSINKLVQLEFYGANVKKIVGSREEVAKATLIAAEGLYYASHSWNPFFFHGTKTFAFEVCEQLNWSAPDALVLPVGNGTLLLGAYIGFKELFDSEIISELPKLIGIQAANCSPLVEAFIEGIDYVPSKQDQAVEFTSTIAEGITITEPIRGSQILNAINETKGTMLSVQEQDIKSALLEMGKKGFYIEPTAAATIAGIYKYLNSADKSENIVSVFTGHGLKNTEKMIKVLSD
jgi:threonine synthase